MHEARKKSAPQSVQEKPVTTDKRPFEEMNAIAKQIKEQTLVVTDDYFKFLKKAISSNPSRGTEVGDVLKSHVEKIRAQTQRSEGFSGRFPSSNRVHVVSIRRIGGTNQES